MRHIKYILHLMWSAYKYYVLSVTIGYLTGEKLKSVIIPVPSIELRNKSNSIVKQS